MLDKLPAVKKYGDAAVSSAPNTSTATSAPYHSCRVIDFMFQGGRELFGFDFHELTHARIGREFVHVGRQDQEGACVDTGFHFFALS